MATIVKYNNVVGFKAFTTGSSEQFVDISGSLFVADEHRVVGESHLTGTVWTQGSIIVGNELLVVGAFTAVSDANFVSDLALAGALSTSAGAEFYGPVTSTLGFSGSLTRLIDGSSYLVAGANITITSASNGSVTIAGSGGGGGATVADLRSPGTTTANANPFGGVVSGTIGSWFDLGTTTYLNVIQSGSSNKTNIEFFSSSSFAETSLLYRATDRNLSGSSHEDGTAWHSEDEQAGSNIYYKMTNNGTVTVSYTIQLVGIGE